MATDKIMHPAFKKKKKKRNIKRAGQTRTKKFMQVENCDMWSRLGEFGAVWGVWGPCGGRVESVGFRPAGVVAVAVAARQKHVHDRLLPPHHVSSSTGLIPGEMRQEKNYFFGCEQDL